MLCFRGVSFSYPGALRPALQNVTLTLAPGEFVVLMGPNGSGKSTLARLGNGLLLPAQGEVVVDGLNTKDPAVLLKVRQRVGLVFQDPDNQIVGATVEEDVAFGPENLGLPPEEIKRRVEEALDILGIVDLRYRPPHRLSGGQKQKVALAGILAMEPRYILLDEATAMLDPRAREEILGFLNFLCRKRGIGLLLVTHLPEEALVADRVVLLYEGVIWKEGTPEEIFSQPEELAERGLGVPQTVLLAQRLAQRGLKLPYKALKPKELAQVLWTLAETQKPI